jgi:hypothetical protein
MATTHSAVTAARIAVSRLPATEEAGRLRACSGGYTYYTNCVSQLSHSGPPIHPTTVDTYLQQFPVDDNDVIHVEDGGWVNKGE